MWSEKSYIHIYSSHLLKKSNFFVELDLNKKSKTNHLMCMKLNSKNTTSIVVLM